MTDPVPPAVRFEGVSRTYDEAGESHRILADVDAEFAAGRFTVLVGKSGSGKTTLLNLVCGIDTPTAGRVWVHGVDVTRMGEKQRTLFRRDRIGVVYQFFNLIPTLDVLENVMLVHEPGAPRAEARRRALEELERVGLQARARSFPERLSGGEQQRVAIARALAHDPDLILADEPTGNLDEETGAAVLDLLVGEVRARGRTLVMATHSLDVLALADAAFTIHGGRLVAVGQ